MKEMPKEPSVSDIDAVTIDEDQRWKHIKAISDAIVLRDQEPDNLESALVGAVWRYEEARRELAAEKQRAQNARQAAIAECVETCRKLAAEGVPSVEYVGAVAVALSARLAAADDCVDELERLSTLPPTHVVVTVELLRAIRSDFSAMGITGGSIPMLDAMLEAARKA